MLPWQLPSIIDGIVKLANPVNTPAPMLSPAFPTCEQFLQAFDGDNCDSLASKAGIPLQDFFTLNPGLQNGQGCHTGNINPGYFYCTKALPEPLPEPEQENRPEAPEKTQAPDKDTSTITKTKTIKPDPTTYSICDYGDCWKSWVKLSTDSSDDIIFKRASRSCESLATTSCTSLARMGFPDMIKEGCDNCAELQSGCSCFLEGKYHTATVAYVVGGY
ncbi:uncharacterized protein F5Z01DRAFT_634466 [Emericellopsis atlantica]|uniref:LysM domain-containing protein n=1 Tax=Emericellopsis atlantica TaxID=2614577 RepID=A0A9P8CRM1_9HYPO|nr:uncharacterized protein F5Z01DRAFT_634466 [Emericellopsis atlantica]KAG9256903.1 hypothetical protein F5Z01DRAFT_634466 [Emericellopsis atlantica]